MQVTLPLHRNISTFVSLKCISLKLLLQEPNTGSKLHIKIVPVSSPDAPVPINSIKPIKPVGL